MRLPGFWVSLPTLCHMEGLSPYGACRLCVVEIGEGPKANWSPPARTLWKKASASARHLHESCRHVKWSWNFFWPPAPSQKSSRTWPLLMKCVNSVSGRNTEDCILCGRCVRMCEEQMMAKAIGFRSRGEKRTHRHAFRRRSEVCRLMRSLHVRLPCLPAPLHLYRPDKAICGGCANLSPPCVEKKNLMT